jgi:hypothetical protein
MVHGGRLSELQVRRKGRLYQGTQFIFTFGYLLFLVAFWEGPAPDDFIVEKERLAPEGLICVWPAFVQLATWPPSISITYAMLNELSYWNAGDWPGPVSSLPPP